MASITFWTRLEPYTRLDDIDAGLQAQTHDPLWLLARQWQTGEFQGEDAGTPVLARSGSSARRSRASAGPGRHSREPYRSDVPLEALVEREPVQRFADPRRDLRVAAEAGPLLPAAARALQGLGRRPPGVRRARRSSQLPATPAAERRRRRPRATSP